MEYKFEKFEKKNVRQERRITVRKSNSLGFPTKFYEENGIENFKYVVLFWDEKNKAIGIYFTNNEEEENKFKIIRSPKGYGGSVVTTSFFKTYNINPEVYAGRYEWEKCEEEGVGNLFVIELRKKNRGG